jgi:hypothetical protein
MRRYCRQSGDGAELAVFVVICAPSSCWGRWTTKGGDELGAVVGHALS